MSDAGTGGRAPSAGLFEKPTVSCELPQLFPLDKRKVPELPVLGSAGGRGVRKLRGDVKLYNEVVDGLNWFSGRGSREPADTMRSAASEELRSLAESRISEAVGHQRAPADTPGPRAAFRELLHGRDAYAMESSGGQNIAPFRSAKGISMPDDVRGAPTVSSLVSDADFYFGNGLERMLRPESEWEMREEELAQIRPHVDPALTRSRRKYLSVVRRLIHSGLFRLIHAADRKEEVGIFFVAKKGKTKVRLVIDARRSNVHFASPPSVDLLTGEGLAGIEIELPAELDPHSDAAASLLEKVKVSLGVSDVSDAFHRMRICKELSAYFCLPAVTAGELRMTGEYLDGVLLKADTLLCPAAGSLPMGFSWSLFFCQRSVVEAVEESPAMEGVPLLSDRSGALVLDASGEASGPGRRTRGGYVYVDNLGVFGLIAGEVKQSIDGISGSLDAKGLLTHEHSITDEATRTLGVCVDGSRLQTRPDSKRMWTLRRALTWALGCRQLAGWVWEVLIGHATFLGLVDRNSLSAFCSIYRFIRAHYNSPAPLWDTAAAEIRAYAQILPLLCSEWAAQWSPEVFASDASEEGYGVCHATWNRDLVAAVGRVKERSRFRRAAGRSARDAYFEAAGFRQGPDGQWVEDPNEFDDGGDAESSSAGGGSVPSDLGRWEEDLSFPEIPHQQLASHRWKVVMAQPWKKRGETIFVYEARALLRSLESFIAYVRKKQHTLRAARRQHGCLFIVRAS